MSEGRLHYEKDGQVARIVFDNPSAYNALTERMWADLRDACRDAANDRHLRVLTFRGVGGKAFISGTDISGFADFRSGADGLAYERRIDECMGAVDAVSIITIAIVEGWAVGGGLNISSACDFRIAAKGARFGSPLGRTIGNCLSSSSYARIGGAVGVQLAKRMLLLGEMLPAELLHQHGFLLDVVEPERLDAAAAELVERARGNAPITTRATKEALRRLAYKNLPDISDLIEQVYGSEDFRLGVNNFLQKTKKTPEWTGR
jgi:enoyl-CoA hydratase/carnithine racemase